MSTSGPPELPGLIGRVGLDVAAEIGRPDVGAGQGRDDAVGHGLADAERIAQGQDQVADLQLLLVVDGHDRQLLALGVDLQHGQVGARIVQQHRGRELAAVGQLDGDVAHALDIVVVGDDHPVGADDGAGAQRALHLVAPPRRRRP
jgi:hypothetical protein